MDADEQRKAINTARGMIMAGKRWNRPEVVAEGYALLRRVHVARARAALDAAIGEEQ